MNNVVVRYFDAIENFPPDHWNETLAVKLAAPFRATRLPLPGMRASGWGRIINVASDDGWFPTVERVDDTTTKTALIGLTRAVAMEVARTAITCSAICPGTVLTPAIQRRLQNEMQRDGIAREQAEEQFLDSRQPCHRFVPDSNVASPIAFLCTTCSRHQWCGAADRRRVAGR